MERTHPDKTEGKIAYLSIIEYIKADNLCRVTELMRQYRFNTQAYDTIFRQSILYNRLYIIRWIYIHVTGLTDITDMLRSRSSSYFRDALIHKDKAIAAWLYTTFPNMDINYIPTLNVPNMSSVPSALCCAAQHGNIDLCKWIITLPTFKRPSDAEPGDISNCLTIALREGSAEATQLIINIIRESPGYTLTCLDYFSDACWGGNICNIELIESILQITPTAYNYGFMAATWNYHLHVLNWFYVNNKIDIRHSDDAAFRELFNNRVTSITRHLHETDDANAKLLAIAQWFCSVCPNYHVTVHNNILTGYSIDKHEHIEPSMPSMPSPITLSSPPKSPDELIIIEEYISTTQPISPVCSVGSIEHIEVVNITEDREPPKASESSCCIS